MLRISKWGNLALLLALLGLGSACGDDGGGAAADAGDEVDADDTDAEPVSSTCGVLGREHFGVGTRVLFSAPDGSVIGVELMDVDGAASRDDCVSDTMITLVATNNFGSDIPFDVELFTVTGVQPGDTVLFDEPRQPNVNLYADVNVNTSQDLSGLVNASSRSALISRCEPIFNSGNTTDTMVFPNIDDACLGSDDNIDVLAYLRDTNSSLIGYAYAKDVSLTTGSSGSDATTEVNLGAWTAFSPTMSSFTISNFSPSVDWLQWEMRHKVDGLDFSYESNETSSSAPFEAGTASLPSGFGEQTLTTASTLNYDSNNFYMRSVTSMGPYSEDVDLDFDATALPRIAGVTVTRDGDRFTLGWLADGSLADSEIVILGMSWAYGDGSWYVVLPGGEATSFTTPILPDSLGEITPPESVELATNLAFAADASFFSYQQIITLGALPWLFNRGIYSNLLGSLPVPGEGSLRRTLWTQDNEE